MSLTEVELCCFLKDSRYFNFLCKRNTDTSRYQNSCNCSENRPICLSNTKYINGTYQNTNEDKSCNLLFQINGLYEMDNKYNGHCDNILVCYKESNNSQHQAFKPQSYIKNQCIKYGLHKQDQYGYDFLSDKMALGFIGIASFGMILALILFSCLFYKCCINKCDRYFSCNKNKRDNNTNNDNNSQNIVDEAIELNQVNQV